MNWTLKDIACQRLISQGLSDSSFSTVKEVVSWMGALQAQDFSMSKWAIGIRLPGATLTTIDEAISSGEILRTHLLRPTWHWVAPEDIRWMTRLTAPRILSAMKGRSRQLELSEKIFSRSNRLFEKALRDGNHLTRRELVAQLDKARIATDLNRSSHILMRAELEGIICSGKLKGGTPTYALLAERVPVKRSFSREESLFHLASRYFKSHGPATIRDFTWWSGLSLTQCREAIASARDELIAEKSDGVEYWLSQSFPFPVKYKNTLLLLPAFDEFFISYQDRSAAILFEHQKKAFSNNGLFWPVVLEKGHAIGTWKKEMNKDSVILHARFFDPRSQPSEARMKKAIRQLGFFLNRKF